MDPINEGVDSVSSMPDVILQYILSFIPIDQAIRTSTLSRRWRHVWCETPCIHFGDYSCRKPRVRDINRTLISYKAPKIKSFHLCMPEWVPELEPQIGSWIEFAVSRNVEQLFLSFNYRVYQTRENYSFPDLFYRCSSLENLTLDFLTIYPRGFTVVSWKSLRTLTLGFCFQSPDHDFLSGCPALETLTLGYCGGVHCLDLSKSSPTLTTLKITRRQSLTPGSMEIVAPHLRYLYLENTEEPCTLVDVSSLTKAKLSIRMEDPYSDDDDDDDLKADFLQLENMLLKMVAQLRNVEELTFKTAFLQIISLAELRGVPFPTLIKVQTLTIKTMFARSVIPAIARLLQNSPGIRKLIVHARELMCIEDRDLDKYLGSQGLNLDQSWRSKYEGFPISSVFRFKDATWYLKLVVSFIEMVLKNVETLETLVLVFKHVRCNDDPTWFEELLQMIPRLSNNNNVSIVLRRR